ncbi:acetylcholine receptor subunit alpha-L1-like [Physella acuta]|uniref:acetylcholine receptor subunit alpha-L1-like n=1 Tax=Physella acuta TaxID=109671 RepID=UPI0027DD047C|nr:acetylcholine receptor subunit alpha-L1-like [Physella acuta]
MFLWKFWFSLLLFQDLLEKATASAHTMTKLHNDLFDVYDPEIRPILNHGESVKVQVTMYLAMILDLDIKKQVLKFSGFMSFKWKDELLVWNTSKYGGIEDIIAPQRQVWKPDITIYNNIRDSYLGESNINVAINHKGRVLWEPPINLEVSCDVDVSKYPFDENTCVVKVISWMHDVSAINITTGPEPINLERFIPNKVFKVRSSGVECIYSHHFHKYYKYMLFKITLTRRPLYLVITVLLPIMLLAILSILSFVISPDEKDKLSVAFTILVAFTVFLSIINKELPKDSLKMSLLVVYISLLIIVAIFAVAGNCLVIVMHEKDKKKLKSVSVDTLDDGRNAVTTDKWWKVLKSRNRASGLNLLFLIFNVIFFVVITTVILRLMVF